jgi:tryptophan 2,3-dioxygenase
MDQPSLPELYDAMLAHHTVTIETLYSADNHLALRMLGEEFLAYEQAFSMWRFLHVQLVERIIGPETGGTGGSMGAKALRQTLENRFFTKLWSVRAKFF